MNELFNAIHDMLIQAAKGEIVTDSEFIKTNESKIRSYGEMLSESLGKEDLRIIMYVTSKLLYRSILDQFPEGSIREIMRETAKNSSTDFISLVIRACDKNFANTKVADVIRRHFSAPPGVTPFPVEILVLSLVFAMVRILMKNYNQEYVQSTVNDLREEAAQSSREEDDGAV